MSIFLSPTGSSQSHGAVHNATVILQQKPNSQQAKQRSLHHMTAYNNHAERNVGKFSYQPARATTPTKGEVIIIHLSQLKLAHKLISSSS